MSELDVGANRHVWETRFAQVEEDLASEPVDALGELLDLVEEMLNAARFATVPNAGPSPDPEVLAVLERARALRDARDAGDEVRHDDAQQAAADLRELYAALLEHPEADAT
jgi:hypothetical protein